MKIAQRDRILPVAGMALILALSLLLAPNTSSQADETGTSYLYMPFIGRLYQGGLGSISGKVTDARNGTPLDGIFAEAEVCYQGTICNPTNANGIYTVSGLATGVRWLTASAQGYVSFTAPVNVLANTTVTQNFPLSPDDLGAGQFRIIVTWDDDPPDLDAHLYTPPSYLINGRPHVFQGNRGDCVNPDPNLRTEACLDTDATEGFGPETITILEAPSASSGITFFHYAVEKYEPCFPDPCPAPIQTSNAVVRVYDYSGLLRTYNVPTIGNPGDKRFWYVFTLEYDSGSYVDIHDVNCFADSPPTEDEPPTCPPPP